MSIKEGKSKVKSRVSTGAPFQGSNGLLYSFNVEFEDGTKGLYSSNQESPKNFIEGTECEYTLEEVAKRSGNGTYNKIKPKKDNAFGGGFKQKPTNVFALELARKMFNSSHQTDEQWDIEKMLKTADWLVGQIDKSSRDAVETATTIACASAMNGVKIDAKTISEHIKTIDAWLKK